MLPILYFVERVILRENGMAAIAITSVAGLSVAIPNMIAAIPAAGVSPEFAATATSQIAFATLLSSIITPLLAKMRFAKLPKAS